MKYDHWEWKQVRFIAISLGKLKEKSNKSAIDTKKKAAEQVKKDATASKTKAKKPAAKAEV